MLKPKEKHKLDEIQQEFIIRCLACGFNLQKTADLVKEEYEVTVTRQNVMWYRQHHDERIAELREELSKDLTNIPFANKLTRVAHLNSVANDLLKRRQYKDFAAILKQIAEETGGIVQKHEHTGKNGMPIDTTVKIVIVGDSVDEDDTAGD
jgi:hypothetical protein